MTNHIKASIYRSVSSKIQTTLPWTLVALLLSQSVLSCADDKTPDPDLELTAEKTGDDEAAASNAENSDEQSAAPKQAIADNGYDDDWNNIGSQQQKQQQQQVANKNKQQANTNQNEPNLANAEEEPAQQQAPLNNQYAQVPEAEPPLDPEPAPAADFVEAPLAAVPVAPPPAVEVAVAPVVSGAPLLRKADIEPLAATLHWVGYDFVERASLVKIEMVTRGSPKFNLFQERNQANQPELVVRFFNTRLRDKVRRDIDASEFRSPVAYVRMRPDEAEMSVDVILTLRDAVQPRMYTRNGNVMLTFPIPDHYFGNSMIGSAPVAQADVIPNANIMPDLDQGSDIPEGLKIAKAFINNPAEGAFPGAPADGGTPIVAPEVLPASAIPENATFPSDFSTDTGINTSLNSNAAMPTQNSDWQTNQSGDDEFNFDGNSAPVNNVDNTEFDGEPTPNQQSNPEFNDDDSDDDEELQNENEQQDLEDDSLEDFDNGEGESDSEIDKFDVRVNHLNTGTMAAFKMHAFSLVGVAQDDLQEDNLQEGNDQADSTNNQGFNQQNQTGTNNQSLDNNVGNGALNGNAQAINSQGQGNFQAAPNTQGDDDLLGEGGQGNVPANQLAPAQSFPGFNETAPQNTLEPPPAPEMFAPVTTQEPMLEGQPDLTGPEAEGMETGQAPAPASAGGRPIKLDFRNAPMKDVVRVLSEESGVNFMVPGDLGDRLVSINLSGVPFNDALKALLATNQMGMVELGPNLVRIDSLERIAADRSAEERRRASERLITPTKILVHRLSYGVASDVAGMLGTMLAGNAGGDKRVSVSIDARTNSLIINASPGELATVKALIDRLDMQTPQVKIASRIIEVLKKAASSFGVSWGGPLNFDAGRGLGFGSLPFPNQAMSRYSVDAAGLSDKVGNLQAHLGSISDSVSLDIALSMEEARGTTEVLQSSNVLVEDGHQATISAGQTDTFRPVIIGQTLSPAVQVAYDLAMVVTPHVTGDGSVGMDLKISNAAPIAGTGGDAAQSSSTRLLETKLLRRTGETAVIGGIYTTSRIKNQTGIPGLSSLPIIGALFRQRTELEEKRELMVMITPTILIGAKGDGGGQTAFNESVPSNFSNGNANASSNYNLDGGSQQQNQGNTGTISNNSGLSLNQGGNYQQQTGNNQQQSGNNQQQSGNNQQQSGNNQQNTGDDNDE